MTTTTKEAADRKRQVDEAKARAHMTVVGAGLRELLGADRAAAVLIGPAVALLEEAGGAAHAVEFFRELAKDIEAGALEPAPASKQVN